LPSRRARGVARRERVEQQAVGDAGIGRDRREVGFGFDRQHFHDRNAEALADRGDALRRLMAVQLEHVGLQGADDLFQARIVGIHDERDCLGASLTRRPRARAASSEILRGLGGKNTKPTTSAPAASATSRVSGVERPQILTKTDMIVPVSAGFYIAAGLWSRRNRKIIYR